MKQTVVALALSGLAATTAFTPSGFMGSSVVSRVAQSNSRIEMIFGNKKAAASSAGKSKAGAAKAGKAASGPKFLQNPAPGKSAAPGPFYIKEDDSLSTALPWVTRPQIGDGSLVGDYGFDPWGLSRTIDVNWMRSAELKHGRLCMLAAVGLVTPELITNPGNGFKGLPWPAEFSETNAYKALAAVPKFGLAQIFFVIALIEIATFSKVYNEKFNYEDNLTPLERKKVLEGRFGDLSGAAVIQGKTGVNPFGNAVNVGFQERDAIIPGDLGFDPLGFADNGVNPDYAVAEIKHARLAMIGVAGMLLQEFFQDKGIVAQTAAWATGGN